MLRTGFHFQCTENLKLGLRGTEVLPEDAQTPFCRFQNSHNVSLQDLVLVLPSNFANFWISSKKSIVLASRKKCGVQCSVVQTSSRLNQQFPNARENPVLDPDISQMSQGSSKTR